MAGEELSRMYRFGRQGVDAHRLPLAPDRHQVELDQPRHVEPRRRLFADDQIDAIELGQPFEPRGQVHRIAEQRIIEALLRSEIADAALAGIDADADVQRVLSTGRPASVELVEPAAHRLCGSYR